MGRTGEKTSVSLVGVDTGGTFTDFIFLYENRVAVHKVPSTPDNPARAVIEGLSEIAGEVAPLGVTYGTTVATNALLERKGARLAWITTRGFEDLIEIGRQTRPELYALEPKKASPLVPRSLRVGVRERVLGDGRVLLALSARELTRVREWLRSRRVGAVAVGFLHAYRNPAHEKAVARKLRGLGLPVSLSHAIVPEHREYERFSTTVVNAYVSPAITRHVVELDLALKKRGAGFPGGFRVMQSNGGAMTAALACRQPVRTLLSGPAGGVVAARESARRAGVDRIISLDMGGTSTDVCLVDGRVPLTAEKAVAGVPVKVPMLDIHTVGAGGGSIARLDRGGAMTVGPESVGADPGPVCYGKGREITVSDANLALGRLDAGRFLGGRMPLDLGRTMARLKVFARQAKMSSQAAAWGILQVVNSNMERAIRAVTLERGLDPKDFTLVAFGGAGGLHAADLADGLGLSRLLIPLRPGLLSAWGMAVTPLVRDFSLSVLEHQPAFRAVDRKLRNLTARGLREMERDGVKRREARVSPSVDMRYAGQAYELNVPWSSSFARHFHRQHQARFGHSDPAKAVEVVTLRARIEGRRPTVRGRAAILGRGKGRQALLESKDVYFDGRMRRSAVYAREKLRPGDAVDGPTVICEFSSTVVVPPGWRAEVDRYHNLQMARG
ncbi:MAG TPA: hydantoinase/oxoprolinase family protein [Candidatus Binatia bacterium]